MSSKIILAVLIVTLISGCTGKPDYTKADGKILCDPKTGEAYLVKHRAIDVSFVQYLPQASEVCL